MAPGSRDLLSGEEPSLTNPPDACFDGGCRHGRAGRLAAPILTTGGAAALAVSPSLERQGATIRTIASGI